MVYSLRSALIFALIFTSAACAPKPLPEAESQAAKTYVANCGGCHVVYRPDLLTAAMWGTMVDRMDRELRRRLRPMSADTKAEILDYLQRNAGTR